MLRVYGVFGVVPVAAAGLPVVAGFAVVAGLAVVTGFAAVAGFPSVCATVFATH